MFCHLFARPMRKISVDLLSAFIFRPRLQYLHIYETSLPVFLLILKHSHESPFHLLILILRQFQRNTRLEEEVSFVDIYEDS